jgi:hypothetical protein
MHQLNYCTALFHRYVILICIGRRPLFLFFHLKNDDGLQVSCNWAITPTLHDVFNDNVNVLLVVLSSIPGVSVVRGGACSIPTSVSHCVA